MGLELRPARSENRYIDLHLYKKEGSNLIIDEYRFANVSFQKCRKQYKKYSLYKKTNNNYLEVRMSNEEPEKELINNFLNVLKQNDINNEYKLMEKTNILTHADVEFKSQTNLNYILEAKTNLTNNKYNEIHKIYGQILKNRSHEEVEGQQYIYGILINEELFFRRGFRKIREDIYQNFGALSQPLHVFVLDEVSLRIYTWNDFYNEDTSPIYTYLL